MTGKNGHVFVEAHAPATTLVIGVRYATAVDLYDALSARGDCEVYPQFDAAVDPAHFPAETLAMIAATPGYLANLAATLQNALNEIAFEDLPEFISAMEEAGTPDEIGAAAWNAIVDVLSYYVNPTPGANANSPSCLELDVGTPGNESSHPLGIY